MNFGQVPEAELSNIDYILPNDNILNNTVLSGVRPNQLQINIGATQWGAKQWVGKVYPPKTRDHLPEYVKNFNSVELNTTFYSSPPVETILSWKSQAEGNPEFRFCPKFPQSITHIRRLRNADVQTEEFYSKMSLFDNQLGPMYLQLSDNFSPKSFPHLEAYLTTLPKDNLVFVELRHKEWFANPQIVNLTFNTFKSLNIGWVISDTPGRRDCVHMALPTPNTFIRFMGSGDARDFKRLDDWVDRITKWHALGLKTLNFFVHKNDLRSVPEAVDYMIMKLNEVLGYKLQRPHFIQSKNLFS